MDEQNRSNPSHPNAEAPPPAELDDAALDTVSGGTVGHTLGAPAAPVTLVPGRSGSGN